MTRYEVMKRFTAGFVEGIRPGPCDDSQDEHWQAGYLAGYKMRPVRSAALDEYLVSTGREPQAKITLAATPPLAP